MNIRDWKEFINKLSSDFNENRISIEVGNKKYQIDTVQLTAKNLVITTKEEQFKDTLFDDVSTTSLRCVTWNKHAKLQMVKATKEAMGLGLKDAKDVIDADVPFIVATGKSDAEYTKLKNFFPDDTVFEID